MGGQARIWDMHVHLDFMENAPEVVADAARLGLGMLAVTVEPDGYLQARESLRRCGESARGVCLGVGVHPWWVADGRVGAAQVDQAVTLAGQARYVGEIGLDLSPAHVPDGSVGTQVAAFEAICQACAQSSDAAAPKVLSIHAVRAADLALDVLERSGCLESCACVFHWFSGSSAEMARAVRVGCLFSVNEMMLRTRRGREYARQLPARQLLLETDMPPEQGKAFDAALIAASLERCCQQIAEARHTTAQDVQDITTCNALHTLGRL